MSDQTIGHRRAFSRWLRLLSDSPQYEPVRDNSVSGNPLRLPSVDRAQTNERAAFDADDGRESDGGLIVVLAAVVVALVVCLLWAYRP